MCQSSRELQELVAAETAFLIEAESFVCEVGVLECQEYLVVELYVALRDAHLARYVANG
jgi:hypothetical protein